MAGAGEADGKGGTPAVVIAEEALLGAVERLLESDLPLEALKVRAGEHLAVIALTSLLGVPPERLDDDGSVDLVFVADNHGFADNFAVGRQVVEVKSAPGAFRRFCGQTHLPDQGELSVKVESAMTVLAGMRILLDAAAAKTAGLDAAARHAVIVVHPLDRLAIELVNEPLIASHLTPLELPAPLDAVWVFWMPDQITLWDRRTRRWTQVIASIDPDRPPDDDGPLGNAEARFLQAVHGEDATSPYRFRLTTTSAVESGND